MSEKRFQVALSFPGEHRDYVEQVANCLSAKLGQENVFYDRWYTAELARPNMDVLLQSFYHEKSVLIVPFLCAAYEEKDWCGLEWRAIKDLIKQKKYNEIMPMRFDDTPIPGFYDSDGYIDVNAHEPEAVAGFILERLSTLTPQPPLPEKGEGEKVPNIRIDRLPTVAGDFFGRETELQLLESELSGNDTKVIQFIASGGTGKTKLLRHWLNQHLDTIGNYLIWSFYSQGTSDSKQVSATPLFTEAFKAFGVDYEQYRTDEDRADAMADLLIEHQCLLVLDGLEPLQHGGSGFDGQLKDRAMKRLLQKLAQGHTSLCIITTRINVHELKDRAHVIRHPLDNLSTDDGVRLLRSWGVRGPDKDMQTAVTEVEGHALTLHLLGNALTTYLDSDIRKRDTLDELVDDYAEQGRHAFKVMQAYQHWLRDESGEPTAELQLLYLLGLFDHPIEIAVLQVLWEQQIEELTAGIPAKAWQVVLRALREKHRLLSQHGERPDLLDCHPLIREYFGRQLEEHQPEAWQQAHEALYHYYKALPEKELPDTVEEMQPLFHAVAHGCAARLYQEVLAEICWLRIQRKDEGYIIHKLGAFNDDLTVLANFFSKPWSKPTTDLSGAEQASLLSWAGFRLWAMGRVSEAVEPTRVGMEMQADQEDWINAAFAAGNLSYLQLLLGKVSDAVTSGKLSILYADHSEDMFWRMESRTIYANTLHQSGQIDKALTMFAEGEQRQQEYSPEFPHLYSLRGFEYCDLLLARGKMEGMLDRAVQAIEIAKHTNRLLDISLSKLTFGGVHHVQNSLSQAQGYLEQAVADLRKCNQESFLPRGLLARAALYRDLDKFDLAQQDLAEVQEIAEPSEMRLHMTDYHLEMARLLLASGEKEKAPKHIKTAETLINQTGYHRRDQELADLKNQLNP